MPDRHIYFENKCGETVWLRLYANNGDLEVHVYGAPADFALPLEQGLYRPFPVDALVMSCIRNRSLSYSVICHYHGRTPVEMRPGLTRFPDGPIFLIIPVQEEE